MLPDCPTFADFYQDLYRLKAEREHIENESERREDPGSGDPGRTPLQWQNRLAATVEREGWPEEIGVHTGLGKTAALDVAVWALAAQADRPPQDRTAPTRVWYVVDRRLLVDAASEHVRVLAQILGDIRTDPTRADRPVARVAARLVHIGGGLGAPLHASTMRGGATLGDRPLTPAQPAIICATVAMYASRLLFRGFGASNRMWPIDAALAGTDCLVILDEAHLAEPLIGLFDRLAPCDAIHANVLRLPIGPRAPSKDLPVLLPVPRARPRLVALTATGRARKPFTLEDEDYDDQIVVRRLDAAKPTELVSGSTKTQAADLAAHAMRLIQAGAPDGAAVVFVNSPRVAREVAARFPGDADVVVLTGQLRDDEATEVRTRLLNPNNGCPSGADTTRDRPLYVVATQTLEVGADLDFDVCVSEMASRRAITQRWGRLNRLGDKPHARGLLYFVADADPGPLYGSEPKDLWARLTRDGRAEVELAPRVVNDELALVNSDEPQAFVPALLPNHLWEYAKTSVPPVGEAPPELFFAGVEDDQARVSVCWRAELPADGEILEPAMASRELLDLPIGEIRAFAQHRDLSIVRRLTIDGATVETVDVSQLRPGDRILVPAEHGGYRSHGRYGFDPIFDGPVRDVSPLWQGCLHLTTRAVTNLLEGPLLDENGDPTNIETWFDLRDLDEPDPVADWDNGRWVATLIGQHHSELAARLWPNGLDEAGLTVQRIGANQTRPLLVWKPAKGHSVQVRVDALDELSIAEPTALDDHLQAVGQTAQRLARAVGLPERWCHAVYEAGRWHDLGKADWRFQRWLGNTDDTRPRAKSDVDRRRWAKLQAASGWPRGARHELLSVQLLDAALADGLTIDDTDLVRHLVISHHGHGRPLVPTVEDTSHQTHLVLDGVTFDAHTSTARSDWDQPERFRSLNERFGYWGLTLLEAIVRQADHLASAATTRSTGNAEPVGLEVQ